MATAAHDRRPDAEVTHALAAGDVGRRTVAAWSRQAMLRRARLP